MNLLSLSFWFNPRPAPLHFYSQIAMVIVIILLIAGFVALKILYKKRNLRGKQWRSLADFCLSNAITAATLLFFSRELVPVLAAKFMLIIWYAEMIFWAWLIWKKFQRRLINVEERQKAELIKKYLPK